MTKYTIQNLKATKNLTIVDLFENGFTNNMEDYYYCFKVISNYRSKSGKYISETINISFKRYYTKNKKEKLKLYSIVFLYENEFREVEEYKNYFAGKLDYSMLNDYYKNGVDVAESFLQKLIDNKVLEIKENKNEK